MKILFLTAQLPFPAISGGVIKSLKLLEYLALHHQVEVACLLKSEADVNALPQLKQKLPEVEFTTEMLKIPRTGGNFLRSLLQRIPLTIYRNRSASFAVKVKALCAEQPLIFVDHYLMFQYVPTDFAGKVVVHQHNAEFLMWWRKSQQENNWLMAAILRFEANRIRQYELAMCDKADVVMVTSNDRQTLVEAGANPEKLTETIHLGDEAQLDLPALCFEASQLQLLFIGTLTWEANLDGLLWFAKEVWPTLLERVPSLKLTIVGRFAEGVDARLSQLIPAANVLGFVDDLEPLYRSHRVFVAPLRFGSGVKIKVVNSLYRGLPVVTTSVGAEGLALTHGQHILIEDDASEYAAAVLTLLKSGSAWRRLSEQSRHWMSQHYTWEQEAQNLKRSLGQ